MFFVTTDYSILCANFKKFDKFEDAAKYAEENDGIIVNDFVVSLIDKCTDTSKDKDFPAIDGEYSYYAVEDFRVDKLDIECFSTEKERDDWCEQIECVCIPISREFAIALKENYTYVEDVCLARNGIVFVRS